VVSGFVVTSAPAVGSYAPVDARVRRSPPPSSGYGSRAMGTAAMLSGLPGTVPLSRTPHDTVVFPFVRAGAKRSRAIGGVRSSFRWICVRVNRALQDRDARVVPRMEKVFMMKRLHG